MAGLRSYWTCASCALHNPLGSEFYLPWEKSSLYVWLYFCRGVSVSQYACIQDVCVYLLACDCDLCNSTRDARVGGAAFSVKSWKQKEKVACRHPSFTTAADAHWPYINISYCCSAWISLLTTKYITKIRYEDPHREEIRKQPKVEFRVLWLNSIILGYCRAQWDACKKALIGCKE